MDAKEAYERLAQSVNIEYYIGPKAAAEIEKACCGKKEAPKPKAKAAPKKVVEGGDA